MIALNKDIVYALVAFAAGALFVGVSFSMILWPFADYLHMHSVVFDSMLAYVALRIVNVIDNYGAMLGVPLLAASVFFLARYVAETTIRWRRIAAISGATITGCYTVLMVIAENFL